MMISVEKHYFSCISQKDWILDLFSAMQYYGSIMIYFSLYMLISAGLMVLGIAKSLRGLLIPWLVGMLIVILFQIFWSIWLCYGYYIYVSANVSSVFGLFFHVLTQFYYFQIEIVIPALIYLLSAAYNVSIARYNWKIVIIRTVENMSQWWIFARK